MGLAGRHSVHAISGRPCNIGASMQHLGPAISIADPNQWALFLDIDGTLVEIEPTPDGVVAPVELIRTLEHLNHIFKGAVAIVTGRRIQDADRILAPLQLVSAGVHGAQMRHLAGGVIRSAPPVAPELLREIMALGAAHTGIVVEDKGTGIAVHYRQAPGVRLSIEKKLMGIVNMSGQAVMLCQGRMVYDIVPMQCSKRTAIEVLTRLPAFEGRRPLVIGDDAPDEAAFAAAKTQGGAGLKVAGEHFPAASADFTGPRQVRAWLAELAGRLS